MRKQLWICVLFIFALQNSALRAQNADVDWLHNINRNYVSDDFNSSMRFLSNSAFFIEAGTIVGLGVYALAHDDKKMKQRVFYTGASFATNVLITYAIKYGVNRQRPYEAYPDKIILRSKRETSPSFVSGHTSTTFNFATSLTLAFPKWYVAVPAYAWATSVAYSRMYLGVHYPSDILGGIVVGVASAYLTQYADTWWRQRQAAHKSTSAATLAYAGFVE